MYPSLQIISEEHDTLAEEVISKVMPAFKRDKEIERLVPSDEIVPLRDVRVWIDPLDATKEYTGKLGNILLQELC